MSISLLSNIACEDGRLHEAKLWRAGAGSVEGNWIWRRHHRGHRNLGDIFHLMKDYPLAAKAMRMLMPRRLYGDERRRARS